MQTGRYPKQLERELLYYEHRGICLSLNGKPSSAQIIIRAYQSNWGSYMREYLYDGEGNIAGVDFRLVRQR